MKRHPCRKVEVTAMASWKSPVWPLGDLGRGLSKLSGKEWSVGGNSDNPHCLHITARVSTRDDAGKVMQLLCALGASVITVALAEVSR